MSRVAVAAPLRSLVRVEARMVAGALLLAAQFQRLAAVVVAIPTLAVGVVLVGLRYRPVLPLRARLRRLRRSPLPLYLGVVVVSVAVGWIVASR